MTKLTLIKNPVEELSEKDRALYYEIERCKEFFDQRRDKYSDKELSKHYLIFAYNYYSLGFKDEARKSLQVVSAKYFTNYLIEDMHQAIWHRNKCEELLRKNKHYEADKHRIQAELFLVATGILPFLICDEEVKDRPDVVEFRRLLRGEKFIIKNAPKIEIVQ